MRQVMVLGALALGCFASAPATAATPWWFSIGFNDAHLERSSEKNCGGGQGAFTFGARLMLRLEYNHVSFEDSDHTDSCDAGYWGDSDVVEPALLVGLMSRTGAFLAVGPSRADFGDPTAFDEPDTLRGTDVGTRWEAGWSSRRQSYRPVGLEVLLFQSRNDISDYTGLGINVTFGPRRPRLSARPLPAR